MYIASSSNTIKFHQFPSCELVCTYQPGTLNQGIIRDISWSKDGNWMSIVPAAGLAEIVSVRNRLKLIHTIMPVEEPSCTAFQNTTKKFIAFGTKSGQVLIYDIKMSKIKTRYPRVSSSISHIEFTAQDSHLVAACSNGNINLYSNLTLSLSGTFKVPKSNTVSAIRTSPSKRHLIVAGSTEGVVAVWDINANKHKFQVTAHKAPISAVAFSPINSDLIITTGLDRRFSFHDIQSNKCIATICLPNSTTSLDFCPDGTHFVFGSQDGHLALYDSRSIVDPILIVEAHQSSVKTLTFQKQESNCSSSVLLEETEISRKNVETEVEPEKSFGLLLKSQGDTETDGDKFPKTNTADSFMIALGLGGRSIPAEENVTDTPPAVPEFQELCEQSLPDKQLKVTRANARKQISTSTPSGLPLKETKMEENFSPITLDLAVNTNRIPDKISITNELSQIVFENVKKEMNETLSSFMAEMKREIYDSKSLMRMTCLNMHMSNIKEFIKLEDNINMLREEMTINAPATDNYLIEENQRLRTRIAILEQQLNEIVNINNDAI